MGVKGIAMSAPMVLALLNTKPDLWPAEPIDASKPFKWQTRRVIKPQPYLYADATAWKWEGKEVANYWPKNETPSPIITWEAPFQPGDLLYVREALRKSPVELSWGPPFATYAADEVAPSPCIKWRWKRDYLPSIFMPKEAARLWLRVMDVGAGRVQEITDADALAEGVMAAYEHNELAATHLSAYPRQAFAAFWDSLNLQRGYGWDVNPWTWKYEIMRRGTLKDEG